MRLTENNRRYIFVGMIMFIIVGIFTSKILGDNQDEQFVYEDKLYNQTSLLFEEGNYTDAMILSNELLDLQPHSEAVNYLGALINAQKGDYKHAAILLQRTMDINPHRVEDPIFLGQYGEVLYLLERFEDAQVVLEQGYKFSWKVDYKNIDRIRELLALIEDIEERIEE